MVLYLARLSNVARVLRQIDFLSTDFEVVVAAFDSPAEIEHIESVTLTEVAEDVDRIGAGIRILLRRLGRYESAYWRDRRVKRWRRELASLLPVDAVVVNSLFALPLAFDLAAPVVFDAHEHWTSESASWSRRQRISMSGMHEAIANSYIPKTAGLMTVSRGIAAEFEARWRVRAELVTNAPTFRALRPRQVSHPIRLLHVGLADERRRLEDTIEAVQSLGTGFSMDLVLARDNAYRRRLEQMVAGDDHVRILPPVENSRLLAFANAYDIGVFLLPARFPNQVHVLPNKLFDYIQARLAVAIGPSPEMAAIVNEWQCGVVSDSFSPSSFAQALAGLTPAQVSTMKANSDRAARVLNAEGNRGLVLQLVRAALGSSVE